MDIESLVAMQEKLESIVAQNNDLIGSEAENLFREASIVPAARLREDTKALDDEKRLLRIGIVGRVKAGKSSLLNALLFDGKSVLPKAATPMTAALTLLSYGKKLSAELDFFSEQDLEDIRVKHKKYELELKRLVESELAELKLKKSSTQKPVNEAEQQEKARRKAIRKLRENAALSAAHDQFEKMEAGQKPDQGQAVIHAKNIAELSKKLSDYVGAEGPFMPFTRSVHICLPEERLQGLEIVDTPGMNDPVQSREERTVELLKYCDVIFIVSPAGQFVSKEDTELLDRITAREGVSELCVVASQIDNQLFGSEKDENGGALEKVLGSLATKLGKHMADTLAALKGASPEIGDVFDSLIREGGGRVLHSSGICQTLKLQFDNRGSWDDGAKKVWENLTVDYPDYFSDSNRELSLANLDKLANIAAVEARLAGARSRKNEIIGKKQADFIQLRQKNITNCRRLLLDFAENQRLAISEGDAEELKGRLETMKKTEVQASSAITEEYQDQVEDLKASVKKHLSEVLKKSFAESSKEVKSSVVNKTETYEKYVGRGGFLWLQKKYETRSREVVTIRAGAVRGLLEDLCQNAATEVSTEAATAVREWRSGLQRQITATLRKFVGDEDLDAQLIRSTIRRVVNSVRLPEFDYSLGGKEPTEKNNKTQKMGFFGVAFKCSPSGRSTLRTASGTLAGSSAEDFFTEATDFITSFKKKVNDDISQYLKSLDDALKGIDVSDRLFASFRGEIMRLTEALKDKELFLDRFSRLIESLEGLDGQS
jgi:predicted GTPase